MITNISTRIGADVRGRVSGESEAPLLRVKLLEIIRGIVARGGGWPPSVPEDKATSMEERAVEVLIDAGVTLDALGAVSPPFAKWRHRQARTAAALDR